MMAAFFLLEWEIQETKVEAVMPWPSLKLPPAISIIFCWGQKGLKELF